MYRWDQVNGEGKLLRFQRLDLPLEMSLLPNAYDITATQPERAHFWPMDRPDLIDGMYALARTAARKQVSIRDFDGFI